MANRKPKSQSQIADEIREKANKAELRAAKAPKADTVPKPDAAPKVEKAKAATPKAAAPNKEPGKNTDEHDRAAFLNYLPKVAERKNEIVEAVAVVNRIKGTLRTLYKQALADGFSASDFEEAIRLQGNEGEKAKKNGIIRSLKIARWLGMDLGAQLDMFEEPSRVPAIDRAFEEGKAAALKGESGTCQYAPDLPQHQKFMEGWHAGQEVRAKGFKTLHPEVAKDEAEKAAKKAEREKAQAEDAKVFDAPASGVAMTRAEFNAQKQQAKH